MPGSRAPWWMYAVAAVFVLTLLFNARQEAWGPANAGWTPAWPKPVVARVSPGSPMDKAGLRAGDVLETADGLPVTGMPGWFVARAHFERDRPIEIQISRGEQRLRLQMLITAPSFRAWSRTYFGAVLAFYLARFLLLALAILVAFSRPQHLTARWAALMLAMGAVAEGYPSPGWAAALGHLPIIFAVPIGFASASCLLAPVVSLMFCGSFLRPQVSKRSRWLVALTPFGLFGLLIATSVIAMIYEPSALAKPWPVVLSAAPVRAIQDIAGVAPLLYLSFWPGYGPVMHARLLELWLAVTLLYFAAGILILATTYRRADTLPERRRMGALCLAFVFFGLIILHNVFTRNWTGWFGGPPPVVFSEIAFVGEAVVFPIVPLTLAYCILAGNQPESDYQAQRHAATPAV